jgi:hypothetical protein
MKDILIIVMLCIAVIILIPIALLALIGLVNLIINMYSGIVEEIKDTKTSMFASKVEKLDGKKVRIYLNDYCQKVLTGVLEKHTEWDSTCCDLDNEHNTYAVLDDEGNNVLESGRRIPFKEIKKIEEIK